MNSNERVSVCHIQYDFDRCIAEEGDSGQFYLNVDKSLDEVEEFTVKVLENGTRFDAGSNNSFMKIDRNTYSATLNGNEYRFRTMDADYTEAALEGHDEIDWTTITAAREPETRYALGDVEGDIRIYDDTLRLQRHLQGAHVSEITSLEFFPSGEVLLSSSSDMQLKIWSVIDGSNPRTFLGHKAGITDTYLIDKGRNFLSSSTDGTIRLWECGSAETLSIFSRKENPSDGINSLALIADPKHEGSNCMANRLEFGTQGKHVLAGHTSGVITVYDLFSKQQEQQLPSSFQSSCSGLTTDLKNNHFVYAGYQNGALAQWDLRMTSKPLFYTYINEGTPINHIYYHSDGLYISSGLDTNLKLDLTPERNIKTSLPMFLVSNDYKVAQFTLAPDKSGIISVGNWGFCARYSC